jgi:hypothetical protein
VAQSGHVIPDVTLNVDEPQTTRVQFKEESKEDKTKGAETAEDGKTSEKDTEAEFAGAELTLFIPDSSISS